MAMNILGATLIVIVFAVLLHLLGLVQRTREVLTIGREASNTLRDTTISDSEKERRMQQSSLRMFRLLALLIIGTAVALTAPLALLWTMQFAGLLSVENVLQMFVRWDFIVGASILGIAAYIASVRWLNRNS